MTGRHLSWLSNVRMAANCVFTPHIAWASLAARKRLMATITANIASFLSGSPINVVHTP